MSEENKPKATKNAVTKTKNITTFFLSEYDLNFVKTFFKGFFTLFIMHIGYQNNTSLVMI